MKGLAAAAAAASAASPIEQSSDAVRDRNRDRDADRDADRDRDRDTQQSMHVRSREQSFRSRTNSSLSGAGSGSVGAAAAIGETKVSEAFTFGPKFVEIYELFVEDCQVTDKIDLNRHLLSLVLEYMIPFVKWARQSEQHISRLSQILLNYEYLRPEVRNGVAVILIYTFSARKALTMKDQDMFTVLSSVDSGLGITNKLTLRIYSDPRQYFNFVKLLITGLIDCGVLPENERQNLPKVTSKQREEDSQEYQAFIDMKNIIIAQLDFADNNAAKSLITTISKFWNENKKQITRGKQFSTVLAVIGHDHSSSLDTLADVAMTKKQTTKKRVLTNSNSSITNQSSSSALQPCDRSEDSEDDDDSNMIVMASASLSLGTSITRHSLSQPRVSQPTTNRRIQTLRYSRTSKNSWSVMELAVFDTDSFFSMVHDVDPALPSALLSTASLTSSAKIHLIDSFGDSSFCRVGDVRSDLPSYVDLESEFGRRHMLVTTWSRHDYSHFVMFMNMAKATTSRNLINMFHHVQDGYEHLERGFLAFEIEQRCAIVLRNVEMFSKKVEDCWCYIYPEDLNGFQDPTMTFGEFLLELFPQLRRCYPKETHNRFIIKYLAVKLDGNFDLPPLQSDVSLQTIGCLDARSVSIFPKLVLFPAYHNFVLENIS